MGRGLRQISLVLAVVLVCGPALAQDSRAQPSGTITVEDSASQDAAIAVRIRDILGELEGFENVTVQATSGIVTLRGTTLTSAEVARLNDLAGRVEGVVAIENQVTETTDVVERLNPAVVRFRNRMIQLITYLPLLAVAVSAFFVVAILGFLIARLKSPWDRLAPNGFIADIYRQIIRLVFIISGIVVALDILDATRLLSTILGAAGIVGLAIGFAVRDTVENFIASIMLSVRQPFRPNDAVEINGDEGKVIHLTSRATVLLSFDGNHIRIPNATVFKSRIVNYSRNAERRFLFDIGVAPDTDLSHAHTVAEEVLGTLPFLLATPAPAVWTQDVGDSTITLRITGWIDQTKTGLLLAKGETIRMILARFGQAGIEMPNPTYTLQMADPVPQVPTVPPPVARPAAPQVSVSGADTQATAEQELEDIVNAERAEQKESDLFERTPVREE